MKTLSDSKALVLLSGGQDSTTCLYWALSKFAEVSSLAFDYGQRHKIELASAQKIADFAKVSHAVLKTPALAELGGSSLTNSLESGERRAEDGLPHSFVPGRNILFLSYAAAYAYHRGIGNLVIGTCQTDYSGYPDCREETIKAMEHTLSLGMDVVFTIHTPLMFLTKGETITLAKEVGAFPVLEFSHTCYEGASPPCGTCAACVLRTKGFQEVGEIDPLLARAQRQ